MKQHLKKRKVKFKWQSKTKILIKAFRFIEKYIFQGLIKSCCNEISFVNAYVLFSFNFCLFS